MTREAALAIPLYQETRDWSAVRAAVESGNLLQARTVSSGSRLARELTQRLAVFTDDDLELLADAGPTERGYVMWAGTCRRYAFIGEFAEEVLRERYLLLTPTLTHDEFDAFVRGKTLWHPELEDLRESTLKKLRSTLFRMLREAGLLSTGGEILPAVVSERLIDIFEARDPSDLRFFPTSQGGAR